MTTPDLEGLDPGPDGTPDLLYRNTDPSGFPTVGNRSDQVLNELRDVCLHGKDSLYLFSKIICGYPLMNERVHLPMARFTVQTRRPGGRRIMLMPRGHLKTTLWLIADAMQQLCLDPNLQFLLVGDTGLNAVQFMREIQNHWMYNELFRTVMHHVIPENLNGVIWNQYQMEVARSNRISRGPSIDAIGALGGSESRHYHRIKADDLITEKCIRSEVEMDKVIKWAGGLESLLVNVNNDCIDFIGSRKMRGDIYEVQEKYYGEGYVPQKIGPHATQRGPVVIFSRHAREEGKVIFPEVISEEFLNRLRKYDPERYYAQYANDPKSEGANTFDINSLRYFRWDEHGDILCIHNGKLEFKVSPWSMDRIVLYDPSVAEKKTSSKQAIHVVAKGSHPYRFVLESRIGHFSPTDAVDHLFHLQNKWKPSFFSIERRGFQGWVKYWLDERAETLGVPYLGIQEWPPPGEVSAQWAKTEHIRALQPIIRANLMWVHEDNADLIEEIEFYPKVRWDDGLDALAQGNTYWPFSIDEAELKKRKHKELDFLEAMVLGVEPEQNRQEERWDEAAFLKKLDATGYTFLRS